MTFTAILDERHFESDVLLLLLSDTNRYMAKQRQAGKPVAKGTIHQNGVLLLTLRDEHWVSP